MRDFNRTLSWLKKTFMPRKGKKGSSLAFVMAIGAALVIWVTCIMPLMTTTGTIAYQMQGVQDDYLGSRSAIEFCKSELEKIVEDKVPYTFAVVGNVEDGFTAIPKKTGATLNPDYSTVVKYDQLDDKKDVPQNNAAGNTVAAICAVTLNETNTNLYDITMTTYHNGEKGIVYTALFTPKGSLKIHPEAYKQSQALPLSDFVLVDGVLGDNVVWNSNITMGNATSMGFTESLLPWKWNAPSADYADSGEYPAVFKTTAHAATVTGSTNISTEITDGDLSDEVWVEAAAVKADGAKKDGSVWISVDDDDRIQVYLRRGNTNDNISEKCTVYLNGSVFANRKLPENQGIYKVSIDFPGDEYGVNSVSVLPFQGLQMADVVYGTKETTERKLDFTAYVYQIDKNSQDNTYSVTIQLKKDTQKNYIPDYYNSLLYGYCSEEDVAAAKAAGKAEVPLTWVSGNVITGLESGKTYFFYVCRPAELVNGVFYADSDVISAGILLAPQFVEQLTSGEQYMIVGTSGNQNYRLYNDNNTPKMYAYSLSDGFLPDNTETLAKYSWTASKNTDNTWSFVQNGKYLNMTSNLTQNNFNISYIIGTESSGHDGHNNGRCYPVNSCTLTLKYGTTVSMSAGLGNSGNFTVSSEGSSFYLSGKASYVHEYAMWSTSRRWYTACNKTNAKATVSYEINGYLNLGSNVSASTNSSAVKFMKIPSAPVNVASPSDAYALKDNTITHGTGAFDFVNRQIGGVMEEMYVNGQRLTTTLPAGVYQVVVKVNLGTQNEPAYRYAKLPQALHVNKANLNANESLTATAYYNDPDELTVKVTCDTKHTYGGEVYFGFQEVNGETATDFKWFPSDGSSFTFRLPYGDYRFAVRESGTINYNGFTEQYAVYAGSTAESGSDNTVVTIAPRWIDLTADDFPKFIYTYTNGVLKWYGLPDGILPSRVTLVFGCDDGNNGIRWQSAYDSNVRFFGAVIRETPFNSLEQGKILQLSQPVNIQQNTEGGITYGTSTISGSSVYFMDSGSSINTHGVDIHVTTDLLVLNSDITGNGNVYVKCYSQDEEGNDKDVLLFIANAAGITRNGIKVFDGRTFYKIPNNVDLCNVNPSQTSAWRVGTTTDANVKILFRNNIYPEINLDIAYASQRQLAHIVSGHTIGWVDDSGVLRGSSADTNVSYAVPVFVEDMEGNVTYKANRILIASKEGSNSALTVDGNLDIASRYFSIDAAQITQSGSTSFILRNLGHDRSVISAICTSLGLSNYCSKTLQVDFERYTTIQSAAGSASLNREIRRFEDLDKNKDGTYDGVNLFTELQVYPLMATYTTSEVIDLLETTIVSQIYTELATVDRYVCLKADGGSSLSIGSLAGTRYKIFANYVVFDSSISTINMAEGLSLGESDIYFNSQESGYGNEEYLGLFKTSTSETYTGTLLFVGNPNGITYKYTHIDYIPILNIPIPSARTITVPYGFYYVPAAQSGNTALSTIVTNLSQYQIATETLKDYSVYVNPDGSLSNAYVDTGLYDSESAGEGGFSGGKVE